MSSESLERYLCNCRPFDFSINLQTRDNSDPEDSPDELENIPNDDLRGRVRRSRSVESDSDSDSSSDASVRVLSPLEVRNSLRKKLNRFLEVSQSCIREIEELHESQAEESVISVILQLVNEGLRHSERLAQGLTSVHSKKACYATVRANVERAKLEAEKTKLEDENRKLEAEKIMIEAEVQLAVAAASEARSRLERMESDSLCLICLSNPRNVVLLPCFHGQYCSTCIERHKATKASCPTCRATIQGTVPCIA